MYGKGKVFCGIYWSRLWYGKYRLLICLVGFLLVWLFNG